MSWDRRSRKSNKSCSKADAAGAAVLERSLIADTRKGVRAAVESARKRLAALEAEQQRLEGMYAFQADIAGGKLVVGA